MLLTRFKCCCTTFGLKHGFSEKAGGARRNKHAVKKFTWETNNQVQPKEV